MDNNIRIQGDWVSCVSKGTMVHIEKLERGFYRVTGYNQAYITSGIVHFKADIVTYATNRPTAVYKATQLASGHEPELSGVQSRMF